MDAISLLFAVLNTNKNKRNEFKRWTIKVNTPYGIEFTLKALNKRYIMNLAPILSERKDIQIDLSIVTYLNP